MMVILIAFYGINKVVISFNAWVVCKKNGHIELMQRLRNKDCDEMISN